MSGQPKPVNAAGGGRVRPCDSFWIITSTTCGFTPHAVVITASSTAKPPDPPATGAHHGTLTGPHEKVAARRQSAAPQDPPTPSRNAWICGAVIAAES